MTYLFRGSLVVVGVLHLLPATLAFLPQNIPTAYGIDLLDANHALLLRHRAVLFGIVAGLLLFAAIPRTYETLAVVIGLLSMGSFIGLSFWVEGDLHPALQQVRRVDGLGMVVLLLGWLGQYKF